MDEFSVLIAGGGVAALEAALTLADVGREQVRVELIAPEPQFWYRPTSVAEPFGLGTVRHFDLGLLAARAGAGMTLGAVTGVDADRQLARTATGTMLPYDALLIACGARPAVAVSGALTFRGPADAPRLRELVGELEQSPGARVAFVVPAGSAWPMPAYELALLTARRLAGAGRCEVSVVTPELRPLQLFGRVASDAVGRLLSDAGVEFVGGALAAGHADGQLLLSDGDVPADHVVALPRLRGEQLDGLVQSADGFLAVDDHCAVVGVDRVFAAGDITDFTIKQGGIAAQQAVAAAEAIAVLAGATLVPHPFRPVLRGLLLTGGEPAYLRHDLAEGGEADWASGAPIWWPPTKIVGRRLTPFLADFAGETGAEDPDLPPPAGVPVEVPIHRDTLAVGLGF
jgi:sulfide:quinone oxidoreductase